MFSSDADGAFYAHVKLANPNPHPIDAYWWTNIGVPVDNTSRVLYSDSPVAVVSGGADGLAGVPFPFYAEDTKTLAPARAAQTGFAAVDHSYPANFFVARENFIRPANASAPDPRALMGIVDVATGKGTAHVQTREAGGRKFWAWGHDASDYNRMLFLSSCGGDASALPADACHGRYLELQAGVAPTQSNTFPMGPKASVEWTEAWAPIDAKPAALSGDYAQAVAAAKASFDSAAAGGEFEAVDAWLRKQAALPASRTLQHGSAFGKLHELLHSTRLSPALDFSAPLNDPEWRPWHELLADGTFSPESLAEGAPRSFMVDKPWSDAVSASGDKAGWTWLHHLHMGIALRQQNWAVDPTAGDAHLRASVAARPNVLALHALGDLHGAFNAAEALICKGTAPAGAHAVGLARDAAGEHSAALVAAGNYTALAVLLDGIGGWEDAAASARVLGSQPLRVARIALLLYDTPAQPHSAISELLDPRGWAVSTSALVPMWRDAWFLVDGAADALAQTRSRRRHPPPLSIDFNGAT